MRRLTITFVMCLVLSLAAKSQAALETFNLSYTGDGNNAVGTGTITIDTSFIFAPPNITSLTGSVSPPPEPWVTAFSLTISNASTSAADGTFGISDFDSSGDIFINLVVPVDFSKDLVGQGGLADFNIFNNGGISTAPSASGPYTIHDASGDALSLTSFAPVPEPATLSLLGVGGLAFLRRSRRRNQCPH